MKKVILAVMLMALALFLILPNLSWAQEDLYQAIGAGCQGADGKASAAGQKIGVPAFSSDKVQKATDAELADFVESGGPQKNPSHACASKGGSQADATRLAAYVKALATSSYQPAPSPEAPRTCETAS